MQTDQCNVLHNRSDCMNRVHDYANETVPKLTDALRHGFSLTKGFQLYSKDKDRLDDILRIADEKGFLSQGSSGRQGSTAYLKSDEYYISVEIQDHYPSRYHNDGMRGYSSEYYKKTIYLWNNRERRAKDYKMLPTHTHAQMDNARVDLDNIKAKISELQDQIYPLKRLLGE